MYQYLGVWIMKERYDNYKSYVTALGPKSEIKLTNMSLTVYILATIMCMTIFCLLVFWDQITRSVFIILPIFFSILIVPFSVWHLRLKKSVADDARKALLFNGVTNLAKSLMFFCTSLIVMRFANVDISIAHICVLIACTLLLIAATVYLYITCRNGKKKQSSKYSLAISISLITSMSAVALHFSRQRRRVLRQSGVQYQPNYSFISLGCLVGGFIYLLCAIIELSKYYVAKKYNIELTK